MVYRNDAEGIAKYLSDTMTKFSVKSIENVNAVRRNKARGYEYNVEIKSAEIINSGGDASCVIPDVDCILFGEDVINVIVYIPSFKYRVRLEDVDYHNGVVPYTFKVEGFKIEYAIKYDGSQTYDTEMFELESKINCYLSACMADFNGEWSLEPEKCPVIVFTIEEGKRR